MSCNEDQQQPTMKKQSNPKKICGTFYSVLWDNNESYVGEVVSETSRSFQLKFVDGTLTCHKKKELHNNPNMNACTPLLMLAYVALETEP